VFVFSNTLAWGTGYVDGISYLTTQSHIGESRNFSKGWGEDFEVVKCIMFFAVRKFWDLMHFQYLWLQYTCSYTCMYLYACIDHRHLFLSISFDTCNRLILRWENLGILSQSQLRLYLMKSQYNTFHGVNLKILWLSSFVAVYGERRRWLFWCHTWFCR
jgi:hypothetical protein